LYSFEFYLKFSASGISIIAVMSMIAKNIVFSGRVQGVGFRFTAQRIALRYELAGFVKNLPAGQVQMLVQGPAEDIDDCLRDISESFASYIRDTKIEDAAISGEHTGFEIAF
jgi:acylphosphatase